MLYFPVFLRLCTLKPYKSQEKRFQIRHSRFVGMSPLLTLQIVGFLCTSTQGAEILEHRAPRNAINCRCFVHCPPQNVIFSRFGGLLHREMLHFPGFLRFCTSKSYKSQEKRFQKVRRSRRVGLLTLQIVRFLCIGTQGAEILGHRAPPNAINCMCFVHCPPQNVVFSRF